jgi:hypothetical protein
MHETELTPIAQELAKYFTARPGDDTWDGFGLEYSMRELREPAQRPAAMANVRFIADYVAVIDELSPVPPSAA